MNVGCDKTMRKNLKSHFPLEISGICWNWKLWVVSFVLFVLADFFLHLTCSLVRTLLGVFFLCLLAMTFEFDAWNGSSDVTWTWHCIDKWMFEYFFVSVFAAAAFIRVPCATVSHCSRLSKKCIIKFNYRIVERGQKKISANKVIMISFVIVIAIGNGSLFVRNRYAFESSVADI